MADLEYSTIRSGELIHAQNFANRVYSAIDCVFEYCKDLTWENTGTRIAGLNDGATAARNIFAMSQYDIDDAAHLGIQYSNAYLALTRHGGLNDRIKDNSSNSSISKEYKVEAGEVIGVAGATKFVLSAFALASCFRQAYYEVFFDNRVDESITKQSWYTFSFFNNDAEPEKIGSDGIPVFANNKRHIATVSGSCANYYSSEYQKGVDEAKKCMWFNKAGDKDETWSNYPVFVGDELDSFETVKVSAITNIGRTVSGHVNITSLPDYGWTGNGFGNVTVNEKKLSDVIKDINTYTAGHLAPGQTLSVGNIISAESMNNLLHYLEDFNLHVASSYYTVYSNYGVIDPSTTIKVRYMIDAEWAVDNETHISRIHYIRVGGRHTALTFDEVFPDVQVKKPFVQWDLEPSVGSLTNVQPGDVIENIIQDFYLKFQPYNEQPTPDPDKPGGLSSKFSWGYYGTAGCKFSGRQIGDDLTEYKKLYYKGKDIDKSKTRVASNLADGVNGSSARIPVTNQLASGNCWAYLRWQNNLQFGGHNKGLIQRWAAWDINLADVGIQNASSYKYFRITSLSTGFNENEPSHYYSVVYLVDLNSVETFDTNYGQSRYITGYVNSGLPGGYGYFTGPSWRDCPGGPPFRKKGGDHGKEDYICPFAITKRYHVYPILTYYSTWCTERGSGDYYSTAKVTMAPYHGFCATYMDLDIMRSRSEYQTANLLSVGTSQKCVRSLCQCQSSNDITFNGTDFNRPYVRGSQRTGNITVGDLPMGFFGINNRHSENIFFKIVNGRIRAAVYISRDLQKKEGGADQSWGEVIKGVATNEYPGYNEELSANGIVPPYFIGER